MKNILILILGIFLIISGCTHSSVDGDTKVSNFAIQKSLELSTDSSKVALYLIKDNSNGRDYLFEVYGNRPILREKYKTGGPSPSSNITMHVVILIILLIISFIIGMATTSN